MNHDLITFEEYATLPEQPAQRFLAIESICRSRLSDSLEREDVNYYNEDVRWQYMAVVASAADALGIRGLSKPNISNKVEFELRHFLLDVDTLKPQLHLNNVASTDPHSVQLAEKTQSRIRIEIDRLRNIIKSSDLDAEKQEALLGKLDELQDEIYRRRVSFAKVLATLAFVSFGVASGTSFIADAPQAIATITSLVGGDKVAETKEQERLGRSGIVPALPPPVRQGLPDDLGDEIPF